MKNRIRILLVDDNPYFVAAAVEFLQFQEALVVETAARAEVALRKAQELELDVILLDLNLGECSGLDLIPAFRAHLPLVRIIILTSMDEEAYRTIATQAGADAFVHKENMIRTLMPVILQQMDLAASHEIPQTAADVAVVESPTDQSPEPPCSTAFEQSQPKADQESKI